ncbi:hypothetical protein G6L85_22020 [Agrobacterium rhizogenes]|uniref:hypothetical protein n=1 Tax=Rhizobium rhizogenes TaxID=359 RepID=UPI00157258B1|nr:hypothetical protein [Rhizobium rhizogenes]NTI64195.1 hypothetical protein [Rhizobium rhizogenes]
MTEEAKLRIRVLLAVQVSLLGTVGPNLRAVTCSWSRSDIRVRAIFDLTIGNIDAECMSDVETEIMSHFPEHEVTVSCVQIKAPSMLNITSGEVFVFKRREHSFS